MGSIEFELTLGREGVGQNPFLVPDPSFLDPSFGSATLFRIPPHVGLCPSDANGDVDFNGRVDFEDIGPFVSLLQAGFYQVQADINFDGEVNFDDIPLFIEILTNR